MKFSVLQRSPGTRARTGLLETAHGAVRTPAFMPVGSRGSVKTLSPRDLRESGVQILLSNTYHLALRPGVDLIEKAGGLHRFMAWEGPILTDSGGFQIFSLAKLRKITEEGVEFQSHIDGAPTFFSPEKVVELQERLGVDIAMPLDQPVALPTTRAEAEEALGRTQRWFERSVRASRRPDTALFGIVQGALFEDLRARSVESIVALDPPGIAIGGLSVGEGTEDLHRMAAYTASLLPEGKPRYLMGVGTPQDLRRAVTNGIDLFDCVLPTRVARTGTAYTSEGVVKLRNARYTEDFGPLDAACACPACRTFTRAYLRHCVNVGEIIGIAMLSLHNVWFYMKWMERIRTEIAEGTFR